MDGANPFGESPISQLEPHKPAVSNCDFGGLLEESTVFICAWDAHANPRLFLGLPFMPQPT
jgi:hypothetical protein